ncbi:MAG: hypothetical protein HKL89_02540 [Candidatus Dormibacteraeota bacterium]|nr:hypothetical protein [Candidatus Dormibacteraeota bacterium]
MSTPARQEMCARRRAPDPVIRTVGEVRVDLPGAGAAVALALASFQNFIDTQDPGLGEHLISVGDAAIHGQLPVSEPDLDALVGYRRAPLARERNRASPA